MLNPIHLRVLEAVARHGSVTDAAKELHYSQPSISHHLRRLEAATGATLVQRAGRGIRLTPEGELLAGRATEILGRMDAAAVELAARVGLRSGRVRIAGFATVLSTLVPRAAAALASAHPGVELHLADADPVASLALLRSGRADIALVFRDGDAPFEPDGVRLVHLLDDRLYFLSDRPGQRLEDHADAAWIGGCERCRAATVAVCEAAGFTPRIVFSSDDMVVTHALVAAGMGVAVHNGLALRAHREPGVHAVPLDFGPRRVYAATYGDPPDPPATAAMLDLLVDMAAREAR
ncbi:ModE molybdate transport repressor domain-containing protein [Glycomyces sambucus]|uniref:ModE molybdate transport repressor domain-containing protein n=1 Tax=Glycomyces sambucus TaxID=380244 RepID=A0A1G9FNP2_9ACTN|nr:LysR family transcriptional regulator [Glycomyces sambucus]SDK89952.1 ModE molybdate transport repressor domain-containing protein [Glycomyces sambucus]